MWRWYRTDVAVPLVAVACVVSAARALAPQVARSAPALVWLGATGVAALLASTLISPFTRDWITRRTSSLRRPAG
jgi:hypothetical protein